MEGSVPRHPVHGSEYANDVTTHTDHNYDDLAPIKRLDRYHIHVYSDDARR